MDRVAIEQALCALGDSPVEIAFTLGERCVKGMLGADDACPLANFIRIVDPGTRKVSIDQDHIAVDGVEWITPAVLAEFISDFDQGYFPDLVAC